MLDEIQHFCIRVFPEPGMSAPRLTRAWVPAELPCLTSTWKKTEMMVSGCAGYLSLFLQHHSIPLFVCFSADCPWKVRLC